MKNKTRLLFILLIIILLIPVLMATYQDTPIKLKINDETIIIYKDTDEISLTSFSSREKMIVSKVKSHMTIYVNDSKLGKEINLGYQKISKDNQITITLKNIIGKKRTITLYTLPKTFPDIEVEGESKYIGDYYITTNKEQETVFNYIFNLDYQGNITYYKQSPKLSKDYQKHTNNQNQIRYTYLEKNNNLYNLIVEDINHKTIDIVTNVDNNKYIYIDDHDYIIYQENKLKRITDNTTIWKIDDLTLMNYNTESIIALSDNKLIKVNPTDGTQTKLKTSFKIKNLTKVEYLDKTNYLIYNNNQILKVTLKNNKFTTSKTYNKKDVIDIQKIDEENNVYLLNYNSDDEKHYQIEEINLNNNKIYFKFTIKDNIITKVDKIA